MTQRSDMKRFLRPLAWLFVLAYVPNSTDAAAPAPTTTSLAVDGTQFVVNGKATFLFGISYYGGLGAPEDFIRPDLDDIQRHGFNWIRVWANWAAFSNNVAAVTEEGHPREKFLVKLKSLVAECDRRGLVVDVSLTRGNGSTGPARLQTLEAHQRAVETIVHALKTHHNWYLDLSNERNIRDKRYTSFEDLKVLREFVRKADPSRLVTASSGSDITKDELREYLLAVKVDFIAPHRPRDAGSARATEARTREYLDWMKDQGRVVPVHYQEPFRRGYANWEPLARDFVDDLAGARKGGAAGWCFHNGSQRGGAGDQPRRSFDLSDKRLFDQLDAEEMKAVDELAALMRAQR
jgi:hypothetical protein